MCLEKFTTSFLAYKAIVIFILSRHVFNFMISFSIMLAIGIRITMMVKYRIDEICPIIVKGYSCLLYTSPSPRDS